MYCCVSVTAGECRRERYQNETSPPFSVFLHSPTLSSFSINDLLSPSEPVKMTRNLRQLLRPLLSTAPTSSISPLVTLPSSRLASLQLHSRSIGNTPKLGAVKDAISAVLHGSSEAREEAGTQHSRLVGRHVSQPDTHTSTGSYSYTRQSARQDERRGRRDKSSFRGQTVGEIRQSRYRC